VHSSSTYWIVLQEFGAQIQKFGLQPSAVKEYQDLWRTVAPEDKQEDATSKAPSNV